MTKPRTPRQTAVGCFMSHAADHDLLTPNFADQTYENMLENMRRVVHYDYSRKATAWLELALSEPYGLRASRFIDDVRVLSAKYPKVTDWATGLTSRYLGGDGENPDDYILVQTDYDLEHILENIGFPKKYRSDISGAIVAVDNADYGQVWLTERNAYYSLDAEYNIALDNNNPHRLLYW